MIRREVMEALYPEFVEKLDKELAEATKFCRSQAKNIVWPKKRKTHYMSHVIRGERGIVPAAILEIMETVDQITLTELTDQIDGKYNVIKGAVGEMVKKGVLIRVDRGLYKKGT